VQVTDVSQKPLVGGGIEALALVIPMPPVDLRLQRFPFGQQPPVIGPRVFQISATPCQKVSGSTPVPGAMSLTTSACSAASI
jgi:hypothetical protein